MDYLIRKLVCGRFPYYLRGSMVKGRMEYDWTGLKHNAMTVGEEAKGWLLKAIQEQNHMEIIDLIKK